ncbi:hypothetical protein AB3R30_16015 [Leptolyngbyaceae cyanobacterium UHCC 1019]
MRSVLREQLLECLSTASLLTDEYADLNPNYVEDIILWLKDLEERLQKFRNSNASVITQERAKLLAFRDGGLEPGLIDQSIPRRKAHRIFASMCLSRVVASVHFQVEQIDQDFAQMREKIAQLLALASTRASISMPPSGNRELWLIQTWKSLAGGDTHSMYSYINATLSLVDRLYILDDLLDNLLESVELHD